MATIKSFSDLEQSRKLAGILPLESADMFWQSNLNSSDRQYLLDMGEEEYFDIEMNFDHCSIGDYDIPAWSLTALLNVLPFPQLSKDKLGSGKEGWIVSVYPNDCRYDSCWHDNPVNACVAMIEKLHELKIL